MFAELLMKEVARWEISNGYAKSVLLILASYTDIDGSCFPSIATICKDTGFSKSTVIRALNWCEENKLIHRRHTAKSTTYTFNCITEDSMEDETGVCQTHEVDSNITKLDFNKKNIAKTTITSGVSEKPTFDMFWAAYPKKRDKGHAEIAFAKHSKHTDPAIIIAGAHAYAEFVRKVGTDPQFIPYATTWLNGKRWDDELEPELTPAVKEHGWLNEL